MVVAALACSKGTAWIDQLCQNINNNDPTGLLGPGVTHLIVPLLVAIAIWMMARILEVSVLRAVEKARADRQILELIKNVMNVLTYLFAIFGGLVTAGLELSIILTFGGIAGLAIGLAFQDIFKNLLAGMFLLVEKPFRLGEVIEVDGLKGTVESIKLRTTILRMEDDRRVVLPNEDVFTHPVIVTAA